MLLAVGLGVLAICGAGCASPADSWQELSSRQLEPWPALQRRAGSFPSLTDGRERSTYGEAVLGYALIQRGLRDGVRRSMEAGVRAVDYAVRSSSPPRGFSPSSEAAPSVFAVLAIAAAYNELRAGSPDDFAAVRARWSEWARRVRELRIGRTPYSNKHIVEATAILELLRTRVRSTEPGTILGRPELSRRVAYDVLARQVPAESRDGTDLLSDAPDYPPAYQALSLAMYARATQLMGARAPTRMRRVLARAALASWRLAAPDGDVAYFGRSQEQVWTLPATAYRALRAAATRRRMRRGCAASPIAPWLAWPGFTPWDVAGNTRSRRSAPALAPRAHWIPTPLACLTPGLPRSS